MTTDERMVRALEKLRSLRLNGYMKEFVGWSYDDNSSKEEENRALLRLETEKVITVSTDIIGAFYPDKYGVLVTGETNFPSYDLTTGNLGEDAIVGDFNSVAYERVCSKYGVNPDDASYRAELILLDGVEPYIVIGQRKYRLRSLHAGKATKIIGFAYTKLGQSVTQHMLKTEADIHSISDVSQAIKDNPFAPKNSPLGLFTSVNPRAITLSKYIDITSEQLEEIKAKAIN